MNLVPYFFSPLFSVYILNWIAEQSTILEFTLTVEQCIL
jgi:hypothetical protein